MHPHHPPPPPQVMYATGVPVNDPHAVTYYGQQDVVGAPYEGAYVHETYVGPVSIVLGCCLLGPILCPLVFLCPVRERNEIFEKFQSFAAKVARERERAMIDRSRSVTDEECVYAARSAINARDSCPWRRRKHRTSCKCARRLRNRRNSRRRRRRFTRPRRRPRAGNPRIIPTRSRVDVHP